MNEEKTGPLTADELFGPVPDDFDGEHMARRMDPSDPDFVPHTVYRDGERDSWAWQADPDPGPTARQMEDWNIHNDHAGGAEYDDGEEEPEYYQASATGPEMYYRLQDDGGGRDRQEFADHWEAGA